MKMVVLGALLCAIPALAQDAPAVVTNPEVRPASAPFDWQVRLQGGQKFRSTIEMTMKMSQGIPGPRPKMTSRMETHSTTRYVLDQNVLSSDEKGAKIEIVYRDATQKTRVMQSGRVQYDFAHPPQGDVTPNVVKSIVGARIRYTINSRGEVSDIRGFEEYFNRIWASAGKGQSAAQQKAFRATFEKMMSPEALKTMFEQAMGALPPEPVAVGDIWNYKVAVPAAMTLIPSVSGQRTFVGRRYGLVVIDEKAQFFTNSNQKFPLSKPANLKGAAPTMQMVLSGTQSGQTLVDEKSGMARQSRLKMRMHGTITLNNIDGKGTSFSLPLDAVMEDITITQLLPSIAR